MYGLDLVCMGGGGRGGGVYVWDIFGLYVWDLVLTLYVWWGAGGLVSRYGGRGALYGIGYRILSCM